MTIWMCTVPDNPQLRELVSPLPYRRYDGTLGAIPAGFAWDGSSVPTALMVTLAGLVTACSALLSGWIVTLTVAACSFVLAVFPKHRHPVASCRHDWRCRNAGSAAERAFADREFRRDVRRTSWWVTCQIGYIGVRVGAMCGVGVHYPHWTDVFKQRRQQNGKAT
jgi:hypothetical protein